MSQIGNQGVLDRICSVEHEKAPPERAPQVAGVPRTRPQYLGNRTRCGPAGVRSEPSNLAPMAVQPADQRELGLLFQYDLVRGRLSDTLCHGLGPSFEMPARARLMMT